MRDFEECKKAVSAAINAGYRHFDTAYFYDNEELLGEAFRQLIAESNGQLKREDLFIVSKCWNTFHSNKRVKLNLDLILKRLGEGFDYIDLVRIIITKNFLNKYSVKLTNLVSNALAFWI
jgi:diketogulonate reductase-like aldo/keto reductase